MLNAEFQEPSGNPFQCYQPVKFCRVDVNNVFFNKYILTYAKISQVHKM